MLEATVKTGHSLLIPWSGNHLEHKVDLDADPDVLPCLGRGRVRTRGGGRRALRPACGRRASLPRSGSSSG